MVLLMVPLYHLHRFVEMAQGCDVCSPSHPSSGYASTVAECNGISLSTRMSWMWTTIPLRQHHFQTPRTARRAHIILLQHPLHNQPHLASSHSHMSLTLTDRRTSECAHIDFDALPDQASKVSLWKLPSKSCTLPAVATYLVLAPLDHKWQRRWVLFTIEKSTCRVSVYDSSDEESRGSDAALVQHIALALVGCLWLDWQAGERKKAMAEVRCV